MKKALIAVLLAATFMIGSVPVQVAQEGRFKKSVTAAKKQFRASIDRFKRCMRGKCTRREAAKVARDVGIAAAAVIAAVYVIPTFLSGRADRERADREFAARHFVVPLAEVTSEQLRTIRVLFSN